jgi:hypothetical protein
MIDIDRYLLVRTASIYIGAVCLGAVWFWRRPSARAVAGAMLASVWNLPIVLALNVAAAHLGWWSFDARGGLLLGVPVDLYLVWVCVWGLVAALAFPSLSMFKLLLLVLGIDLVLMPAASPVVALGPSWLAGETAGLLFGLLPGQMLARWTARDECLIGRAILQVVAFSGLVMFVLPAVVIDGSGSAWSNPLLRPVWQISLIVQVRHGRGSRGARRRAHSLWMGAARIPDARSNSLPVDSIARGCIGRGAAAHRPASRSH